MERGDRPWGHYLVLIEGPGYKVKQFVVRPGSRLSLQRHRQRAEHWHVVRGKGEVTLGKDHLQVAPGSSVDIPLGAVHRVESVGKEDLIVIEVQTGEYLGEDDIERFEDDYGRTVSSTPAAKPKIK